MASSFLTDTDNMKPHIRFWSDGDGPLDYRFTFSNTEATLFTSVLTAYVTYIIGRSTYFLCLIVYIMTHRRRQSERIMDDQGHAVAVNARSPLGLFWSLHEIITAYRYKQYGLMFALYTLVAVFLMAAQISTFIGVAALFVSGAVPLAGEKCGVPYPPPEMLGKDGIIPSNMTFLAELEADSGKRVSTLYTLCSEQKNRTTCPDPVGRDFSWTVTEKFESCWFGAEHCRKNASSITQSVTFDAFNIGVATRSKGVKMQINSTCSHIDLKPFANETDMSTFGTWTYNLGDDSRMDIRNATFIWQNQDQYRQPYKVYKQVPKKEGGYWTVPDFLEFPEGNLRLIGVKVGASQYVGPTLGNDPWFASRTVDPAAFREYCYPNGTYYKDNYFCGLEYYPKLPLHVVACAETSKLIRANGDEIKLKGTNKEKNEAIMNSTWSQGEKEELITIVGGNVIYSGLSGTRGEEIKAQRSVDRENVQRSKSLRANDEIRRWFGVGILMFMGNSRFIAGLKNDRGIGVHDWSNWTQVKLKEELTVCKYTLFPTSQYTSLNLGATAILLGVGLFMVGLTYSRGILLRFGPKRIMDAAIGHAQHDLLQLHRIATEKHFEAITPTPGRPLQFEKGCVDGPPVAFGSTPRYGLARVAQGSGRTSQTWHPTMTIPKSPSTIPSYQIFKSEGAW